MVWVGPGVLKFGNGLDVVYLQPDTELDEDKLARLKKSGVLDTLVKEKKVVDTSRSKFAKKAKKQ